MTDNIYTLYTPPEPCGYWVMHDGMTRWACFKQPSRWLKFWHRVLLGWDYESYRSREE